LQLNVSYHIISYHIISYHIISNCTENIKFNIWLFSQNALTQCVVYRVNEKEKLVDHEGEVWPSMPYI